MKPTQALNVHTASTAAISFSCLITRSRVRLVQPVSACARGALCASAHSRARAQRSPGSGPPRAGCDGCTDAAFVRKMLVHVAQPHALVFAPVAHRLGGAPAAGAGPRSAFPARLRPHRVLLGVPAPAGQDAGVSAGEKRLRAHAPDAQPRGGLGRPLARRARRRSRAARGSRRFAAAGYSAADFGAIVAAACLAHDIGNPPFGHAGEAAIQSWFNSSDLGRSVLARLAPEERADFARFEGNAQTFSILARLGMPDNAGGMQLTCATLAAVAKYPRAAQLPMPAPAGISGKKHNFFLRRPRALRRGGAGDRAAPPPRGRGLLVPPSARVPGGSGGRHQLLRDRRRGRVSARARCATPKSNRCIAACVADPAAWTKAGAIATDEKRVEYLRARTIDALVAEAAQAFAAREPAMLIGRIRRGADRGDSARRRRWKRFARSRASASTSRRWC